MQGGGAESGGGTSSGGQNQAGGGTESGGAESGGGTSSGGAGSGGAGSGASAGSGGAGSGGGTGSGGATLEAANCPTTADLGVRLVGRHDGCTEGAVRQAWSGTGFLARIDGTGLSFDQDGPAVEYTVVVDGTVQPKVVTSAGRNTTVAIENLTAGEHLVEVYRRGEASFGTTTLYGVLALDGSLLSPPAAKEHQIEIVGDSITCGYGNEGADTSCGFSADTENHYMTYGAILARSYDADLSTVAWSGRGVVSNYGGEGGPTLPDLYERAIPDETSSVWDFAGAPQVDLVVINLGTNDYSTDNDPTDDEFVAGYTALLSTIRGRHPAAAILCTVGPLLSGTDLTTARANIGSAVAARVDAGDELVRAVDMTTPNQDPGCDWHPSIPTHTAMADELAPTVEELLGW